MKLDQVDGNLCSHLILASAKLDSNGNISLSTKTINEKSFSTNELKKEINNFKYKFPQVKLMISVSNDQESQGFQKASIDSDKRQRFARSAIEFLQSFNLDGIDLDWEFPNNPTNFVVNPRKEYERLGLIKICNSIREAIVGNYFNRQVAEQHQLKNQTQYKHTHLTNNQDSQVESYLLTLLIGSQEAVLKSSYDFKQLTNFVDWFNIKSYDYFLFKPYTPFTGPNSPLYSIVDSYVPILNKLSFTWTLNRLLVEDEIPKEKIIMGIPTFGRAYRLMFKNNQPAPFTLAVGSRISARASNQFNNSLNSTTDDDLLKTESNHQNSMLSTAAAATTIATTTLTYEDFLIDYKEICDILKRPDTVVEFDIKARVPYLLTDDGYTWLSYENIQSVREKVRTIINYSLAGYMTWNLNTDNIANNLSNGSISSQDQQISTNFPLHRAMLEELAEFSKSLTN